MSHQTVCVCVCVCVWTPVASETCAVWFPLREFVSTEELQSGCLRSEYSLKPQRWAGEGPLILALNQRLSALQIAGLPPHIIGQFQLASVRGDDSVAKHYTKYYSRSFNDQNMLLRRHDTVMLFAHYCHLLKKAIMQGRSVCVGVCVCVCVGLDCLWLDPAHKSIQSHVNCWSVKINCSSD